MVADKLQKTLQYNRSNYKFNLHWRLSHCYWRQFAAYCATFNLLASLIQLSFSYIDLLIPYKGTRTCWQSLMWMLMSLFILNNVCVVIVLGGIPVQCSRQVYDFFSGTIVNAPRRVCFCPGLYYDWIRLMSTSVQNRHRALGPVNLRCPGNRGQLSTIPARSSSECSSLHGFHLTSSSTTTTTYYYSYIHTYRHTIHRRVASHRATSNTTRKLLFTHFHNDHILIENEKIQKKRVRFIVTVVVVVVSVRCQSVRGMFYSRHAKRRSDSLVFLLEERGDAYAYNARDSFHNNNSGTGKKLEKKDGIE